MADPPKNRAAGAATPPPRLERVAVPQGPPPVVGPAAPPVAPRASPPAGAPPPAAAPVAAYGLSAPEVTAAAAIAAGLAQEGSLALESGLRLFALCASTQASGRLTILPPGKGFRLVFRKGVVEHAASASPEDALPRFLLFRGAVSGEQVAQAEAAAPQFGGDVVAALVTLRLVNPGDIARWLQEHGAQLVTRALHAEEGSWRWEPGVAPPAGAFPIGPSWTLLGAAVRALDAAAVRRRLGTREHLGAVRVGGRIRPEELRLTPQEARAASQLDGRRLADVARASTAETTTVLRVALLLAETELLTFVAPREGEAPPPPPAAPVATSTSTAAPPPPPAAPVATSTSTAAPTPTPTAAPTANPTANPTAAPTAAPTPTPTPVEKPPLPSGERAGVRVPPPPRPTPPPPAPRAAPPPPRPAAPAAPARPAALPPQADPAALAALLARLTAKETDLFQVLGVKQDATPSAVKIAYFQLAKTYHPDTVPTGAPAEVKQLCADVFSRISEAWGVLGDEARRAKYLDDLKTGAGEAVDVMAILQAENVFQAGTLLVKARRYEEAIAKFADAMVLNPDEPEFSMWKAWCEFLLAADKKKVHPGAASTIEVGLKKNPRCAQGYLFLGQMAKLLGDVPLAEKHLKRGLGVAPDHSDLQRELKYLRK